MITLGELAESLGLAFKGIAEPGRAGEELDRKREMKREEEELDSEEADREDLLRAVGGVARVRFRPSRRTLFDFSSHYWGAV